MYNDIQELTKELELFKSNMSESGQFCELQKNILSALRENIDVFNGQYSTLLDESKRLNENIQKSSASASDVLQKQSEAIVKQYNEVVDQGKKDAENQRQSFLDGVQTASSDFEEKYKELLAQIENVRKSIDDSSVKAVERIADSSAVALKIQSDEVIKRFLEIVDDSNKEIESRQQKVIKEMQTASDELDSKIQSVIVKSEDVQNSLTQKYSESHNDYIAQSQKQLDTLVEQQKLFDSKCEIILSRLDEMDVSSVLEHLKKVNTLMIVLLGGTAASIILALLALIF